MKTLIQKLKNLFAKISGKAKTAAAKAAETPEAQDAAHTAATAMSESMPMSAISGKKIAKTFLKNIILWILPVIFAYSMYYVYKLSAAGGNIAAMSKTADFQEKKGKKGLAEEQRRRAVERFNSSSYETQQLYEGSAELAALELANTYSRLQEIKPGKEYTKKNLEDAEKFLELFPDSGEAQFSIAMMKQRQAETQDLTCDLLPNLKNAAEKKQPQAQFFLGYMYSSGQCVGQKDEEKALKLYKESAERGYADAQNNLGLKYQFKAEEQKKAGYVKNASENFANAFKWLKKAAENGNRFAQYNLAVIHEGENEDNLIKLNENKSRLKWLKRAAEQGYAPAQHDLGLFYLLDLKKYNAAEAEKWFKSSAAKGYAPAQTQLAYMYDNSDGVPGHKETAMTLFKMAAEQNYEFAKFALANKYLKGDQIVKKDSAEALKRFEELANDGYLLAISQLGRIYSMGWGGVARNYAKAFSYFKTLTDQGNYKYLENIRQIYENISDGKEANLELGLKIFNFLADEISQAHYPPDKNDKDMLLYTMGLSYMHGDQIINKDVEKAFNILNELAKYENPYGQEAVAKMYEEGLYVAKNLNKAKELYEKAAEQGSNYANYKLGNMYFTGKGAEINYKKAKKNFEKSALAEYPRIDPSIKSNNRKKIAYEKEKKEISAKLMDLKRELYFLRKFKETFISYRALSKLGIMYYKGKKYGVFQDYLKAIEFFSIAHPFVSFLEFSDIQDPEEFCSVMGFYYFFIKKDDKSAFKNFILAGSKGNDEALFFLDKLYNLADGSPSPDRNKNLVEFYKIGADSGDEYWINRLGDMYAKGEIVNQDYSKAKKYYARTANAGNSYGLYRIGQLYEEAPGTQKQDYKKAHIYYNSSAYMGNANAMLKLGNMYYLGHGVKKDMSKAVEYFDSYQKNRKNFLNSDEADNLFAQGVYAFASGVYVSAEKYLTKSALQNYPPALNLLGFLSYNGIMLEQDKQLAINLYAKAAELGDCDAMGELGKLYYTGEYVKQDCPKAIALAEKGNEKDCPECQNLLGTIYTDGICRERDSDKAISLYRKAAENGVPAAQANIGAWYAGGQGKNKPDFKEAFKWYIMAAEQGFDEAQASAGLMCVNGEGTKQDYVKAKELFEKSAEQSHAFSQFMLGYMYENGLGTRKNPKEAKNWYEKAAAQGHKEAQAALERLGKR